MKKKLFSIIMIAVVTIQYIPIVQISLYASEVQSSVTLDALPNIEVVGGSEYDDNQLIEMFNVTADLPAGSYIEVENSTIDYQQSGDYPIVFKVIDEQQVETARVSSTLTVSDQQSQAIEQQRSNEEVLPTIDGKSSSFVYEEDVRTDQELISRFEITTTQVGEPNITVDQSAVNYSVPGDYPVVFTNTDQSGKSASLTSQLSILDIGPKITFETTFISAHVGTEIDYIADFGAVATEFEPGDLNDTMVIDNSSVVTSEPGRYQIYYSATDSDGTSITEEVTLSLSNTPPVVTSLPEATINEHDLLSNDEFIDLYEIEAVDEDGVKAIYVDDSGVDYDVPGEYGVYINASDVFNVTSSKERVTLIVNDVLPQLEINNPSVSSHIGDAVDYQALVGYTATEFEDGDLTAEVIIDDSGVDYNQVGTYQVDFAVSDNDGNTVTDSSMLTITNDKPQIVLDSIAYTPQGTVLSNEQLIALFNLEVTDLDDIKSIDADPSSVDFDTPDTYQLGFTATDEYGQVSDVYVTELVITDVMPSIVLGNTEATTHIGSTPDYNALFSPVATEATTGDLTSAIEIDSTQVDLYQVGTYPVDFTITDKEGNKATVTGFLTVENDTPVITADSSYTINEETVLTEEQYLDYYNVEVNDRDVISVEVDDSSVEYDVPGTYNVTLTATDEYGATSSLVVSLEVLDVLPIIEFEQLTAQSHIEDAVDYQTLFGYSATELVSGDLTSEVIIDDSSVNYGQVGEYQVTFTVSDNEGNTVSEECTIVITNDKPVLTLESIAYSPEAQILNQSQLITLFDVEATDLDNIISIVVDDSGIDFNTPGTYDLSFTATDEYGQISDDYNAQLVITDILPTIGLGTSAVTVHIGTEPDYIDLFKPVASEIVDGDLTAEITIDSSQVIFDQVGVYPVIFTVSDDEDNVVSVTGELTVENDNPVISADASYTINEETVLTQDQYLDYYNVEVTDTDKIMSVVVDDSGVDYDVPGTYNLAITATDEYGANSSQVISLEILDVLPILDIEKLTASSHIGDEVDYQSLFGYSASELVSGDLTTSVIIDDSSVNYEQVGDYQVTFTVSDNEGNTVSKNCTLTITNDKPLLSLESIAYSPEAEVLSQSQLIELFNVEVTDLDQIIATDADVSSVDFYTPGTYDLSFTATDEYGQISDDYNAQLVITDILPTIGLGTSEVTVHIGSKPDYTKLFKPVASEISEGDLTSSITIDSSQVIFDQVGVYPVIFTVSDDEGNVVSVTGELTVENDNPVISADSSYTINEETVLSQDQYLDYYNVEVTDADKITSIVIDDSSVDYDVPGKYSLTLTATDEYGASSSQVISLEIIDLLPSLTVENRIAFSHISDDVDYQSLFGYSATEITEGDLTTSVVIDDSLVNYLEVGPYKVNFIVSDNEGNTVTEERTIVITDDSPEISSLPVASSPEGLHLSEQDLLHLFEVEITDVDGIKDVSVDMSDIDFTTPDIYYVGFIAEDVFGKPSTKYYAQLNITDTEPTISLGTDQVTIHIGDDIDYRQLFEPVATEIITGDLTPVITIDSSQVVETETGTYPVVFKVGDDEGNLVEITGYLTIENDNPVITGSNTITIDEESKLTSEQYLAELLIEVSDYDPISELTVDDSNVDYSTPGTYQLLITAVDDFGASSVFEVEVIVTDVKPVITVENPAVTITIGDDLDIIADYQISATELVSGDLTAEIVIDDSAVDYTKPGQYLITLSVSDNEGNVVTTQVELNIEDKPAIITPINKQDENSNDKQQVESDQTSSLATTGGKLLSIALITLIVIIVIKLVINIRRK